MANYFYKAQTGDRIIYINCQWLNAIDLNATDANTRSICTLTLTDLSDYWTGTVVQSDLDEFYQIGGEPERINEIITAALCGADDLDNQPLSWDINVTDKDCKMNLIGYMKNSLPFEIGSITVSVISKDKHAEFQTSWMERTVDQSKKSNQVEKILRKRNKDLEQLRDEMEEKMLAMTQEKVHNDIVFLQKVKELLNSKKRKIRRLKAQIQSQNKDTSTLEPASSSTSTKRTSESQNEERPRKSRKKREQT